jgi:hypothetical protein
MPLTLSRFTAGGRSANPRRRAWPRGRSLVAAAGALALALTGGTAVAQTPVVGPFPAWPGNSLEPAAVGPRSETVFNRPRPDYDPLGIRWGSFIVNPSLSLAGTYDSNIFATETGALSDFFVHEIPAVGIKSDWSRHALGATVGGDFRQYVTHTTENVNNFSTDVGGRYDISNGEYFAADALYQLQHEDRSSPNAVFGKNPTQYVVMGADLSYVHMVGVLGLRVDTTFTSYDFNNAVNGVTGATINQQFRDRNEYVIAPRLQYEIEPGYNAFIRLVGNERQYFSQECTPSPCTPASQGIRRNSHGWEVDAGTAIEITRILAGEVYVGYLRQHYENPLLKSPSGISFGGNLIWNATPLTSVIGSFSESVAETTLESPTASSSLETGAQLTVQHELLRNLLLLGSVGYVHDAYQGNPRVDGTFGVDAGVKYLLSRRWTATADLNYSQRNSNVANSSYNRFQALFAVKLAY